MAFKQDSAMPFPPDLTQAEAATLVSSITDWSIAHGLVVKPAPNLSAVETDPNTVLATSAPVTLFPSPFPRVCFEQARSVQKAYNQLYAAIAQDEEFLKVIVEELLEVDDFIADLWRVHLKVKQEGYTQPLSLGLFRSDYMAHQHSAGQTPVMKQVEFNTIASSFGGLSSKASDLHKYLSSYEYPLLDAELRISAADLPINTSIQSISSGLAHAYDTYLSAGPKCILFLIADAERNVFDQRLLEYELHNHSSQIHVFRLLFSAVMQHTTVADTAKRELYYCLPSNPARKFEVAVAYHRAAYAPEHYDFANAWDARFHIERSNAIKCPSILTQLAGAKKVQQVLATPKEPEKPSLVTHFLPAESEVEQLCATFTNIYPLDDTPAGLEARKLALDPETCKNYVLKPQREGGGNNIYRQAIPSFLRSIPVDHWKSYILMEIITPPPLQNMILRNGILEKGGVICELGVFGTCLWNSSNGQVLVNEEGGYLLRTKGDQSEEGGVAAGFGAMDSCFLV